MNSKCNWNNTNKPQTTSSLVLPERLHHCKSTQKSWNSYFHSNITVSIPILASKLISISHKISHKSQYWMMFLMSLTSKIIKLAMEYKLYDSLPRFHFKWYFWACTHASIIGFCNCPAELLSSCPGSWGILHSSEEKAAPSLWNSSSSSPGISGRCPGGVCAPSMSFLSV